MISLVLLKVWVDLVEDFKVDSMLRILEIFSLLFLVEDSDEEIGEENVLILVKISR